MIRLPVVIRMKFDGIKCVRLEHIYRVGLFFHQVFPRTTHPGHTDWLGAQIGGFNPPEMPIEQEQEQALFFNLEDVNLMSSKRCE